MSTTTTETSGGAFAGAWRWSVEHSPILNTFRWAHHRLHPQQRADASLHDAGLPGPIAEKIRAIVTRTRLWSAERDQVCRELIAHSHDALKTTGEAESIADSLGEPRSAGRLIRRAMKRKRSPLYKARLLLTRTTVAVTAAFLLLYVGLFIRFQIGSPNVKTDYLALMNQHSESFPESDRLYPVLKEVRTDWGTIESRIEELHRELVKAAQAADEPLPENPTSRFPAFNPQSPLHSRLVEEILAFRPQIDRLVEATRRPVMGFVYAAKYQAADGTQLSEPDSDLVRGGALIGVLLPNLGYARQSAPLLAADARLAAMEGDAERVTRDLTAITNIARLVSPDPFLLSDLVALAVHNIASSEIRYHLSQNPDLFSPDQLLALSHSLAASSELAETTDLQGETYLMEDLLQRMFTDDGHGDGRLTPEAIKGFQSLIVMDSWQTAETPSPEPSTLSNLAGPLSMEFVASRGELSALHRQHMDAARAALARGPQALPELFELAHELESMGQIEQARLFLVPLILPAITKAVENFMIGRMQTDATVTALAIEYHRRTTGAYPATLDELVPQTLPAVPGDPFDPGKAMKYRLTDSGPMLYVVAADGTDDAGTPPDFTLATARPGSKEFYKRLSFRFPFVQPNRDPEVFERLTPDGDWILFPPQED